jgi:hypothetical protein
VIVPQLADSDAYGIGPHYELTPARPTGETYLRVCDLDLNETEKIEAFVSKFGPLGGARAYDAIVSPEGASLFRWYSGAISPQNELKAKVFDLVARGELPQYVVLRDERDPQTPFLHADDNRGKSRLSVDFAWSLLETVNEFRFVAACIRDLDIAWQALRTGVSNVVLDSVLDPPDVWNPYFLSDFVTSVLSCFLRPLSPQLAVVVNAGDGHKTPKAAMEPVRETANVPLYTICALELFNHMVSGAEYRICANERCGLRFVNHQGRSTSGQHRSDAKFCQASCSRNTAQRKYRRSHRARTEKNT